MGPIEVRRRIRNARRHAAGLLLVLTLGTAVAVHHSEVASGGTHHDMAMTAAELCVGVFTAVGTAVAAISLGFLALGRWPTPALLAPTAWISVWGSGPCPSARAGPSLLAVVCVWRR